MGPEGVVSEPSAVLRYISKLQTKTDYKYKMKLRQQYEKQKSEVVEKCLAQKGPLYAGHMSRT